MKMWLRLLGLLTVLLMMGVGIGLVMIANGSLNPYLRGQAEALLSEALGLPVRVGELQGNPLGRFRAVAVRVGEADDPALRLGALEVDYRPFSLLAGQVQVDTLRLVAPRVLVATATQEEAEAGSWPAEGSSWTVQAPHVEVRDGEVTVRTPEAHEQVKDVNLELGFQADSLGYALELRRFQSVLLNPPLTIAGLRVMTLLQDGRLLVEGMQLDTPGSRLFLDGVVRGLSDPEYTFDVRADSLSFEEAARFIPGTYPDGKLYAEGRVTGTAKRVRADLRLAARGARLQVAAEVGADSASVGYDITLQGWEVDLAHLLPAWDTPARFDVEVHARGVGLEPQTARGRVEAVFSGVQFAQIALDSLRLNARLEEARVAGDFRLAGPMGRVSGDLKLDLAGPVPLYDVVARVRHLNLARMPEGPGETTDLNGEVRVRRVGEAAWRGGVEFAPVGVGSYRADRLVLRGAFQDGRALLEQLVCELPPGYGVVRGTGRVDLGRLWRSGSGKPAYELRLEARELDLVRISGDERLAGPLGLDVSLSGVGFQPDSILAHLNVEILAPKFLETGLDSARIRITQEGRRLVVDRMILANPLFILEGQGSTLLEKELDLTLTGALLRPDLLRDLVGVDVSGDPVRVSGRVGGLWSAPEVVVELRADSLNLESVPMVDVDLQARWPVLTGAGVKIRAGSVDWAGRRLAEVFLDASVEGENIAFLVGNQTESEDQIYLWGTAGVVDSGFHLALDSLFVRVDQVALANEGPVRVGYDEAGGLKVERFRLTGPAGRILARDLPDSAGAVEVRLEDVDLRPWAFFLGLQDGVSGTLTGEVVLSGTVDAPRFSGVMQLEEGNVSGVQFESLSSSLYYGEGRAELDLSLVQVSGREAVLSGRWPMNALAGPGEDWLPDGPVQMSLRSKGLDLSFVEILLPDLVRKTSGTLAMDVGLRGTVRRPELEGWIKVSDGAFGAPDLNQRFHGLQADVQFDSNRVWLKKLEVKAVKGVLTGSGEVLLARPGNDAGSAGANSVIRKLDLRLAAREFEALNLPELNGTVNADLQLTGDLDAPRLEGRLELLRAVVQLSSFIEAPPDPESVWTTSPFFLNLDCQVRIAASRNVWIRDENLNVEIAGDLDLRKDREGVRLYGALNSRQGRYEFQGRSFTIDDRGEIQFQGKSEIDPELYILGQYRQRLVHEVGGEESLIISVIVGGTLLHPKISLESDPTLPEEDILSYLIFGRPAQDMTSLLGGEGGGGGLEGQAAGLVLGVAANQLKQKIGRELNLDVLEIDLGEGAITRVRVGKYIGSKLFISYAQDISTSGTEVTVEYDLLPQLSLEVQQQVGDERYGDRQAVGIVWKREW